MLSSLHRQITSQRLQTHLIFLSLTSGLFLFMSMHVLSFSKKSGKSKSDRVFGKTRNEKTMFHSLRDPDSYFEIHDLSRNEPYRTRIIHIQEQCRNLNYQMNCNLRTRSFKYNDDLDLVMCETPKAASTSWQLLLLRLSGFEKNFTDKLLAKWAYDTIPNKHFEQFSSNKEAWTRVKKYTSFLITRHPFNRLVSAYNDKFTNRSTYPAYKQNTGRRIALEQANEHMHGFGKRFRYKFLVHMSEDSIKRLKSFKMLNSSQKKDVLSYIRVMKTGEVSFPQLVKFLAGFYKANRLGQMDIHWRPQTMLCQICAFNYSYIIRFENIVSESNRLLTYLQEKNLKTPLLKKILFPRKAMSVADDAKTQEAFKKLSFQEINTLRKIYEYDFLFYNYDPYKYDHGV